MGLREDVIRAHPDFPWLADDDGDGLASYLESRGFLDEGESFLRSEPAGEGNMNLTLRIHTSARRFILKQSRPWVEKYPEIAAPWNRSQSELRFYQRVQTIPAVAARMPQLIAGEQADGVLLLEDLPNACDLTSLYLAGSVGAGQTGGPDAETAPTDALLDGEIDALAAYLAALHSATRGKVAAEFANREMRSLNHSHLFVVPLATDNGLDLDAFEAGLADAAQGLRTDTRYCKALAATGDRYLRDGPCLVHADYYPGSWLRTPTGIRIIDPEFSFPGDPEVDLGCAIAHLALAGQARPRAERFLSAYAGEAPDVEPGRLARYAAVEVMRRLIGVAQLPLPTAAVEDPPGPRSRLLERSRRAMTSGRIADLF